MRGWAWRSTSERVRRTLGETSAEECTSVGQGTQSDQRQRDKGDAANRGQIVAVQFTLYRRKKMNGLCFRPWERLAGLRIDCLEAIPLLDAQHAENAAAVIRHESVPPRS